MTVKLKQPEYQYKQYCNNIVDGCSLDRFDLHIKKLHKIKIKFTHTTKMINIEKPWYWVD